MADIKGYDALPPIQVPMGDDQRVDINPANIAKGLLLANYGAHRTMGALADALDLQPGDGLYAHLQSLADAISQHSHDIRYRDRHRL